MKLGVWSKFVFDGGNFHRWKFFLSLETPCKIAIVFYLYLYSLIARNSFSIGSLRIKEIHKNYIFHLRALKKLTSHNYSKRSCRWLHPLSWRNSTAVMTTVHIRLDIQYLQGTIRKHPLSLIVWQISSIWKQYKSSVKHKTMKDFPNLPEYFNNLSLFNRLNK